MSSPRPANIDPSAEIQRLEAENAELRRRIDDMSRQLAGQRGVDTAALATVLSALPDLIFILDAEGRYLEIYTGEHNLLAAPYGELRGRTVREALPADAAREIQSVIDDTLADDTARSLDYPLQVPQGKRWFNATIVPITFAGRPCVLWVARDVTERKQVEVATQRARDAAMESDRLKSQFLANVSHELRTPLNGVVGFAELLRETALDADQAEYTSHLETCANSLLDIINEILDFSRMEAGRVTLAKEPFDLVAVVQQVIGWFRVNHRKRPLDYICDIEDGIGHSYLGDSIRIRQILVNLLNNATKFTDQGQISVQVRDASTSAHDPRVRLIVTDTGIGISESALETIFDPFVQVDGSAARRFEGTGLGLSIVRTLVELFDGDIEVASEVAVGSTFTVTLPLHQMLPDNAAEEPGTATAASPASTPLPALRILVAEDNPFGQKIIDRMLSALGHRVTLVGDGEQALDLLVSESFDLVLMDCQMPGIDGYEATRRLRALSAPACDTPVVALTANAAQRSREQCLAAGMNDHLSKPVARVALADALRRWAGTR